MSWAGPGGGPLLRWAGAAAAGTLRGTKRTGLRRSSPSTAGPGHRTTTNYRLFNDKYTTLGVKARRAGGTSEQPCPWCPDDPENTSHVIARCTQPTVVRARRLFLNRQRDAVARAKLTGPTRKALSAIYSIQRDGTMPTLAYPSEHETKLVVDSIIDECGPTQEPLRDFYTRLWETDPTD